MRYCALCCSIGGFSASQRTQSFYGEPHDLLLPKLLTARTTKEHIPPKAFFPKDQRNQLLTVPSCELHNNAKSSYYIYVLAHICLNSSPSNTSRDVFAATVVSTGV